MNPLISIIIPIYNKIRYIKILLSQISEQSLNDYECLLIDDGSIDGSEIVCDEFVEKDARFRVFHISNNGVSYARNLGLSKARGRYITFIDADDEIHRDYLNNLYKCLFNSGADMVIGSYKSIYDTSTEQIEKKYPLQNQVYLLKDLLPEFVCFQKDYGMFGWCWAKLFPAVLVEGIGFDENLKLAEDFDFYLKLYPKVQSIFFDDKPYYCYRQTAENSSSIIKDEEIDYLAQLKIYIRYRSFLKEMKSFEGMNKELLNQRLSDYVFFVLFHSPISVYSERFEILYNLILGEQISLNGKTLLQKWMFILLKKKKMHISKGTMKIYRFIRKMVKGS